MKILFLSLLYTKKEQKEILKLSNIGLQESVNTFQWNIINGLDENIGKPIDLINTLPVGTYPKSYKRLIIRSYNWSHCKDSSDLNIGFINFSGLKQYIRYKKYKNSIELWLKKNEEEKDKYIIIYSLYTPFLQAIKTLKKNYKNFKSCIIVTDLPNNYGINTGRKGLPKLIETIEGKKKLELAKGLDFYVLLTKYMKDVLDLGNKPFVVVEGVINYKEKYDFIANNSEKKIILYSGSLNEEFGIDTLLKAFKSINKENYELWLCGNGDMVEKIKHLAEINHRIKFFGYLSREKVLKLQQQATVLVNPRTCKGEYTKYSFPSKTMEYLASGTPVICYKLSGIPEEYDNYLNYIEGNSYIDMADKLIEICEMNEKDRKLKGDLGKNFIIKNKNNIVQVKKIIEMFTLEEK